MKCAEPKLGVLDVKVMKALSKGPMWVRSLGAFKPIADRLCDQGLVERIAPGASRARNQMQLTAKGHRRLKAESFR